MSKTLTHDNDSVHTLPHRSRFDQVEPTSILVFAVTLNGPLNLEHSIPHQLVIEISVTVLVGQYSMSSFGSPL